MAFMQFDKEILSYKKSDVSTIDVPSNENIDLDRKKILIIGLLLSFPQFPDHSTCELDITVF